MRCRWSSSTLSKRNPTTGSTLRATSSGVGALYLVHDVNLIIEEGLLPNLGIPVGQFSCVGQATSGNSRPDIKFIVQGKQVLVLEYKRT
jgi:hypothetical protein